MGKGVSKGYFQGSFYPRQKLKVGIVKLMSGLKSSYYKLRECKKILS